MIKNLRKIEWTDARLIRLSIVLFFGLVLFVYLLRSTDILNLSKTYQVRVPQFSVVPTLESIAPTSDDTIIFPGETVTRMLDQGGIQQWVFEAGGGEVVDISVAPVGVYDEGLNIVVELYDPQGQPLLRVDEGGAGQPELLRGLTLPIVGEYTIWITDQTYTYGGNYKLNFVPYRVKATHPLRIGVGETLRDALTIGEYDYWVFSGEQGQAVSVTLLQIREREEGFAPQVQIYDPAGDLIAELPAATTDIPTTVRNLELPRTGTYTIWVMDDGYDTTGEYALSVQGIGGKADIQIPVRSRENQ
jgi:hypothetical protein